MPKRIIFVDDEPSIRGIYEMLEPFFGEGYSVTTASGGDEALALFAEQPFDVIVSDLTMPRMDGEETFRELRRLDPDAYVLLMSGFNEQEAVGRFVGKGLAGFIQKPFTPDQLREKLRAFFT